MATQSTVAATRRPGVLGVHSIAEFGLTVPDLGEAARFYSAFGLETRALDVRLGLAVDGISPPVGMLREGPRKALDHLAFAAL